MKTKQKEQRFELHEVNLFYVFYVVKENWQIGLYCTTFIGKIKNKTKTEQEKCEK